MNSAALNVSPSVGCEDLVVVTLQDTHREAVHGCVAGAMVGGWSDLYGPGCSPIRKVELRENQVVGLACHGAFALLMGDFNSFLEHRKAMDADVRAGDGGCDFVLPNGTVIDVKGSEVLAGDLRSKALGLCLTQARNKTLPDAIYVLAVTRRALNEPNDTPREVVFVGWLYGRELCGQEDNPGLKGWSVYGQYLRPMRSLP